MCLKDNFETHSTAELMVARVIAAMCMGIDDLQENIPG